MARLTGQVDEQALLGAVRDLAERHHVLRGVLDADGPEPPVRAGSAADVPVSVVDLSEDAPAEASAELDCWTGYLDGLPPCSTFPPTGRARCGRPGRAVPRRSRAATNGGPAA
ncbi:hypothetical protein ACWCPM_07765 [Streptomyces sp. NPDC002309]